MSFSAYYFDFNAMFEQQIAIQNMANEYRHVVIVNKELEEKNQELKRKISFLENDTLFQKKQITQLKKVITKKGKRKYSTRRLWLQKKFSCEYDHCQNKYSSQVALNSHIRRKHMDLSDNSF